MTPKKTKHAQDAGHHSHKPARQTGAHPEASQLDAPEAGHSEMHLEMVVEGPVDVF